MRTLKLRIVAPVAAVSAGAALCNVPALAQDAVGPGAQPVVERTISDTTAPQAPAVTPDTSAPDTTAADTTAAPAADTNVPATTTEAVDATDLAIGEPVYGTQGEKIGEINRVTTEPNGSVSEIQVTIGDKAGLNAKAVAISAAKIVDTNNDRVKLSMSADEAKGLPLL